jgi:hypothetical protein
MLLVLMLAPVARAGFAWELRVGAKGAFTGNLFTEPDDAPPNSEPVWGDAQFFVGGGGGLFVEVNFLSFLGLEVDLLYQANALTFEEDFGGFEYDYTTRFKQLRLPLLIKGTLPLGMAELSLGVGPAFVFGLGAGVDFDIHTALSPAAKQAALDQLDALYDAERTDGTFLDVDLGINLKVWKLFIPISLRVGINLDQPDDYDGRVTLDVEGTTLRNARVRAIESYQFSLLAGVGWLF